MTFPDNPQPVKPLTVELDGELFYLCVRCSRYSPRIHSCPYEPPVVVAWRTVAVVYLCIALLFIIVLGMCLLIIR